MNELQLNITFAIVVTSGICVQIYTLLNYLQMLSHIFLWLRKCKTLKNNKNRFCVKRNPRVISLLAKFKHLIERIMIFPFS